MTNSCKALAVLNILMSAGRYMSTEELTQIVGCDRKTVYRAVTVLELNGFGIDVVRKKNECQRYKYIGLYGLGSED